MHCVSQSDKHTPLFTHPSWRDSSFNQPRTVYGREEKGLTYEYSDRLWEWAWEKSEAAYTAAKDAGHTLNSAAYFEAYLGAYYGYEVELRHVMAGVNLATGAPYLVFGFNRKE